MSATGFHPEPSANAPWTRTIVLTAACAGDDAARAAPVRKARIMRFMVHLRYKRPLEIAIYRCAPQLGFLIFDHAAYNTPLRRLALLAHDIPTMHRRKE